MSAPTPLRVRLPFRSEDEFVAQYGAHVGRDGFFLATRAPKPVGAQLLFDLILADGTSLLRGEGVVVRSNAGGERPGMTLRFVRLEATGKALVERIVSSRAARLTAPAEAHPSAWAPPAGPSVAPATPPRDSVGQPAHPEAWAPPAGPVPRPQPPRRAPTPAAPVEVSSDEVAEAGPGEAAAVVDTSAEAGDAAPVAVSPDEVSGAGPEDAAAKVSDTSEQAPTPDIAPPPGTGVASTEPRVAAEPPRAETPAGSSAAHAEEEKPELVDTSLEAWAAAREAAAAKAGQPTDGVSESEGSVSEVRAPGVSAREVSDTSGASGVTRDEEPTPPAVPAPVVPLSAPASPRAGEEAPSAALERPTPSGSHPPLDDSELPELVVTEFKGPGPLRPVGLEHTPASADVHAAITPPAGTLVATELDEPPTEPAPRFQLDAPVRGDEPIQIPESSFHDVAQALGHPGSVHERPTTPIPLLPSMETAAPDEIPIPPPPPLDEAPVPEEGAVRIEPAPEPPRPQVLPFAATRAPASAPPPAAPAAAPPVEAGETVPAPVGAPAEPVPAAPALVEPAPSTPAPATAPVRAEPVGTAELGIEINPDSVRVSWFHDGRAEPLVLDAASFRAEVPVRLVREPGAPPRMLGPEAPDVALWVGAPLPFLGTRADSDASRTVARRWPAAVVPDDRGEAAFALEGGTVGATELIATLLRWVRHRTEELTSHQPGRVVLTVPVAFNTLQRERLHEAAERAGFEGVRLVQAPTAATMAFARGRGLARRRILVWRMGASTCDVAVLAASGDDLDMVTCGGDASLGSVNFDEQIALALDKSARGDAAVLRKRIAEAAQLRTQLEDPSVTEAIIDGARLSRAELEVRTTALVERGVLLAREVLRSASLTPESLDELVLVGTATRLPHVRKMVEEAMGRTARTDVDVAAAVSAGAATLAHLLPQAGPKSASRTALHEVLGVPLEIVTPELGQVRVLDRGTRLPAEKTLTVTLGLGTPLEVQVFQGPARAPDPRSFLGLLRAPADRAGDWTLTLSLDTDGVLRAAATNPSGKRQPLPLQIPAPGTEAETPPPQRMPSEPETPAPPPRQETGVLGGLKRLFGRR